MSKKLVLFPAIDADRLKKVHDAAGSMRIVNCADDAEAHREIVDADGFFGKISLSKISSSQDSNFLLVNSKVFSFIRDRPTIKRGRPIIPS